MNLYIKTLFVIGCFLIYSYAVSDFGPCTTPNFENARCILMTECTSIYLLLTKNEISDPARTFLKSSQCGYKNNQVHVCCPKRYITEEAVNQPDSNNPQQTNYVHPDILPKAPDCGEAIADHIVGGNVTGMAEFPWLALLEYTKPGNVKGHHCGGSLINDQYVLTAAHCLPTIPSEWRLTGVRLGEWNRATNPDCVELTADHLDCTDKYVEIPIAQAIPHPEYNPRSRNQYNDIALLRLQNPISFKKHKTIKPVCLPYHDQQRDNMYVDETMVVSGWGATETEKYSNIKLKAAVTVRDLQECSLKYTQQRLNLHANQMCAGGVEGVDSCRGDSGGPLVVLEKYGYQDNYYLAGIVSFGPTPCGLHDWPAVYTRVGPYLNWIASTVSPSIWNTAF